VAAPGASLQALRVEPLAPHHDRDGFSCGTDSLDHYLRTRASQDVRCKANGVFMLVDPEKPETVLGYYTLCATALPPGDVPAAARKHVPRYPLVSATLIGRLAVAEARQGERLGAVLLADAVRRAHAAAVTIGSSMLVVDAIDDRAACFFAAHGFVHLLETMRLVLPMLVIEKMLQQAPRDA
jgi:GNAT superfamily N-acetyltransferase